MPPFLFMIPLLIIIATPVIVYVIQRGREVSNLTREIDHLRKRVDDLSLMIGNLNKKSNNSILPSSENILPTENICPEDKKDAPDIQSDIPFIQEKEASLPSIPPHLPPVLPKSPFLPSFPDHYTIHAPTEDAPPSPNRTKQSETNSPSSLSMEYFVGTKLLSWIGGFTLFLGLSFFVKYSIENNLVSPVLRVILTYLSGILLLGTGLFIRKFPVYSVLSHTLMAVGTLVLYLGTCAGKLFYDFPFYTTGVTATFLILTTTLALYLSVKLRSHVIAVLGVAGGFITPYILATGADNTVSLFIYTGFLNTGLAAIILFRRWTYLAWLGIIGTTILTLTWSSIFPIESHGVAFLLFTAYVISLYTATAFRLDNINSREGSLYLTAMGTGIGLLFLSTLFLPQALDLKLLLQKNDIDFFCFILYPLIPLIATGLIVRRYPITSGAFVAASLLNIVSYLTLLNALNKVSKPEWQLLEGHHLFLFGFFSLLGLLHMAFAYILWRKIKEQPFSSLLLLLPMIFISVMLPLGYFNTNFDDWDIRQSVTLGFLCVYALGSLLLSLREGKGSYLIISLVACTPFFLDRLIPAILVTVVFFLFPLFFHKRFKNAFMPWFVSALSPLCLYLALRHILLQDYPSTHSWLPGMTVLLLSVPLALTALKLQKKTEEDFPRRKSTQTVYWAFFLGFITLSIGEFFENEWLTIALALEGAALMWLNRKLSSKWLVTTGMAFMVIVFIRLILNPEVISYHPDSNGFLWNWYLYTYGIAILSCLAGVKAINKYRSQQNILYARLLNAESGILLFALVNLEIANTFTPSYFPYFSISFGSSLACDLTYSIAWGLFAMGLLILGLVKHNKAPRITGLVLLGITLLKLFLYDLSALDQMFRIAALVVLSVIILISSLLYQKYLALEKKRELQNPEPPASPHEQ